MWKKLINLSQKTISKQFIVFISIISLGLGNYQAYAEELTYVKVCINDSWEAFQTNKESVGEFLESIGITLNEKDVINVNLEDNISENSRIIIEKAVNVNFYIGSSEPIEFLTNAKVVGKAINELTEETGLNYSLSSGQSSASKITENMDIYLLAYEEEYKTIRNKIDYETIIIENDQVLEGTTTVKTAGSEGIEETVIKEVYLDGEFVLSEVISESIVLEPVNEVIEVGTKKPVPTISTERGEFVIVKELTMRASAYTSSVECTGKCPGDPGYGITASGMRAQYGVVAVDKNVIPLGTKLYIEGYGYAIAGDTGGAIKGNKIDLYFNTYSEAINYGVNQVKVYVLGDQV